MSSKIVYYCDFCGKEMEYETIGTIKRVCFYEPGPSIEIELCNECYQTMKDNALYRFFKNREGNVKDVRCSTCKYFKDVTDNVTGLSSTVCTLNYLIDGLPSKNACLEWRKIEEE